MIATGFSDLLGIYKSDVACLMCHGEAWAAWKPGMERPVIVFKWGPGEPFVIGMPGSGYYKCGCGRFMSRLPKWVNPLDVKMNKEKQGGKA